MNKKMLKKTISGLFYLLMFVLIFSWGFYRVNPLAIFHYLGAQVGTAVGISVGVPENPFNSLAQQLEEKETQLREREETLEEREAELEQRDFSTKGKIILALVLGITIFLFVLILLNFYLDYRNRREQKVKQEN